MKMKGPGFYEITGLAWSGSGKIRAVDVSVDGGKNWREAKLEEPVMDKCLTRFKAAWNWDGSPAVLMSRAVDSNGYVQPTVQDLAEETRDRRLRAAPQRDPAMGGVANGEVRNVIGQA